MENQENVSTRGPIDYLKIFFRRKWMIIVPAFIGLLGGIMACFLMPRTWQSTTTILIEEEKMINPLIQNLAVSTTALQRMQSIREILLGWTSLVELTQKLNMAKDARSQKEFENLILGLRKNISVQMSEPKLFQQMPANNIVRISYFGKNPQQTLQVAQTLTDILMEKNLEAQTKETDVAIKFITEQLAIYKRKIKESEVANLKEQLKTLLADSTEEHPMVKELRQKLATAEKELNSGEYKVTGTGEALNGETRETLKKELDKIITKEVSSDRAAPGQDAEGHDANTAIYKLMLMDKVDSSLAKDITVNEELYNMLLQKLETAKITQRLEASKEGTRYTIIDPPRLPLDPVKPNKIMVVFMGLFLGAGCGIGLVFAREFVDQSILDIEDAKHSLNLPILGAISRITLQEEVEKEKAKKKTLIIGSLISSVVLIIIAILISFFR
jgi:uncharacterized protein involved in exopolysaccharide biosynthesis